jgi:transcriptional regulator GlxA family with amidase domain
LISPFEQLANSDSTRHKGRSSDNFGHIVTPPTVAIIGYDGCTALDLTAAAETFHTAAYLNETQPYDVVTASVDGSPFRTGSGLSVTPDRSLSSLKAIDTLILPGGSSLRNPEVGQPIANWIRANEPRIRRIASVCTGLFGLAATGLLDGRRAATHWRFADQLKQLHPGIEIDADALFVRDGKFTTSAGVTAGIDLALALIEEDLGPSASLAVAREMVVYVKRPGGQQQYSAQLRFQTSSVPRIRKLVDFIEANLHRDLSIERLADEASLSPRHFSRLFRQSLGVPPGEFVEQIRLHESTRRLTETEVPIEVLTYSLGYRSGDAFSRAFRRQFGIAPSEYRERFRR